MKKKKNFWLLLAITFCMALCMTACGEKDGSDERRGKDDDEEGYAYLREEYPDSVMLKVANSNWGLVDSESNYCSDTDWIVTYDGHVVSYAVYHLDGEQERVEYDLSKEDMETIWDILDGKLNNYQEDIDSACDGEVWRITYYKEDEETPEQSFFGYIYGKEPLELIAGILENSREDALAAAGITYDPDAYLADNGGQDGNGIDRGDVEMAEYNEEQLRQGYVDYSVRLLQESVADKLNSMISPLSVMMALDMAAAGANGTTQDQITELFCPGASQAQIESYCNDLMERYAANEDVELHIANSLWINDRIASDMNTRYLDRVNQVFDAVAKVLPFNNAAVTEINHWVDENTNGMIDKLLNAIPDDAVLYLINATAVEAPWADPYEDSQVWEDDFTDADGHVQTVEMMHSTEGMYFESDEAVGFMKYYEGYDYGFLTILPNEGISVEEYIARLTGEKYQAFYDSGTGQYEVHTMMPKFTYEYEITMNEALKTLGVTEAFDEFNADFTGIAEPIEGNLYINRVLHKTFIEVGQYETRAAAVTAIEMMCATAAPIEIEYKEVYLNRPFIYAIVDTETGAPIFMGTLQAVE